MSDEVVQFRTARAKGKKTFFIDDDEFELSPVTVGVSEHAAKLLGQLGTGDVNQSDLGEAMAKAMQVCEVFIPPDQFDRFKALVNDMEPADFVDMAKWMMAGATGRDPTQPASSPDGSSTTGLPSPDGASGEASPTPSDSPSTSGSTPTSS
jgi:hypothetical protein